MEKEFNLSEKIGEVVDRTGWERYVIPTKDIKEFIKRLKEDIKDLDMIDLDFIIMTIDKLAGSKLI